jgi:hypothetical protein
MTTHTRSYIYHQISLFSATLALILPCIFYMLRFGLSERYIQSLLSFTGLSLVLILSPLIVRKEYSEGYKKLLFNDTMIPLHFLFVFSVLGKLFDFNSKTLGAILIITGGILYLFTLHNYVKRSNLLKIVISILAVTIFGIYLSGVYWSLIADPLFIENMTYGKFHSDMLYHSSIAQMVKTHGVPSTGLDLFPIVKYHFGSHFLIGCLSGLLNVSVIEFYNFGYAIIFLPLLLRTMLSFIVTFQYDYLKRSEVKLDFLFWFTLFAPFLGFMILHENTVGLNSGIGYQIIVWGESYCISFIYTFILFSTFVTFNEVYKNHNLSKVSLLVTLFIVFPILVFLTGLTKISTLLLVTSCCCYLFVRLKLYKKWYFTVSVLLILAVFGVTFYLANDPLDGEGGFYWFQFINEIIKAPWYVFLPVHYSLTILFCIVSVLYEELYPLNKLRSAILLRKTIILEVLLVIAFVGFIPGEVLKFYGFNSIYFSEFQYWIAASFILCYLYPLRDKALGFFIGTRRFLLIPISIIGLYIGHNMFKNILQSQWIIRRNLSDRCFIAKLPPPETEPVKNIKIKLLKELLTRRFFVVADSVNATLGVNINSDLMSSEKYLFLQKLLSYDARSVSEKRKMLIRIDSITQNNPAIGCFNSPYFFPAITGAAMYGSFSIGRSYNLYDFETYKRNKKSTTCPSDVTACDALNKMGFKYFVTIDLEKLSLKETPIEQAQ